MLIENQFILISIKYLEKISLKGWMSNYYTSWNSPGWGCTKAGNKSSLIMQIMMGNPTHPEKQ